MALARISFELGWRSISTFCWILHKELAISTIFLEAVEKRLPRIQSRVTLGTHRASRGIVNSVAALTGSIVGGLASRAITSAGGVVSISRGPRAGADTSDQAFTIVQLPGPLRPGQTGERLLVIENGSDHASATIILERTDLTAVAGARISADYLRFDPPSLSIPPLGTGQVVMSLTVPEGTASGRYEGFCDCQGLRSSRMQVSVAVA